MIKTNLDKLNSATKYPSISTYHEIGDRGILKNSILIPFNDISGTLLGSGRLIFTEKIDGTNARIILFSDGGYFIGSREDLLTASGDLIYNPSQGIVEAVKPLIPQIKTHLGACVYVLFGEVYGAKINNGKNYTQTGKVGFRLFDVMTFNSEYDLVKLLNDTPVEKIASWRDHGGQTFLAECDLRVIAEQSQISLTPRLPIDITIPKEIPETLEWLKQILPGNTNAPLDGTGGKPEGVVVRTFDRSKIAKIRFEDYERTLRQKKG